MATHNDLGKLGESLALKYLQQHGFTILAQNYRFKKAEVDIICRNQTDLVFVEVKTRSSRYYQSAHETVGEKKQELLKEAAANFMEQNEMTLEPRFDILFILFENETGTIEHVQDAFWG